MGQLGGSAAWGSKLYLSPWEPGVPPVSWVAPKSLLFLILAPTASDTTSPPKYNILTFSLEGFVFQEIKLIKYFG